MKLRSLVTRVWFGFSLIACASVSAETRTPPAAVEGLTYVKTVGAISEYALDSNGLQVLLMPEHSAPVLTFMVTYRVGSRNEVTGTTGATHLLEHLMFKGTDKFLRSKGTGIDQILERVGAVYNATTSRDRTNYYENIPSDQLPIAVEMEADRMRHLLLRDADRKPEMTVVRNEFERGENNPYQALIKEIYEAAFVAHPYHHPVIGWRSDIENVPIEKLRAFYDTFYWPENATVSVIGDFQPEAALQTIKKFYGEIPRAPHPIPQLYTEEPEQTSPRHVGVKRAGELGVVAVAHKVPPTTHPDTAALQVLSEIFTDGKNSRLYRALTDKNLTTDVQAYYPENRDPTLHVIFASLAPGAKHDEVERVIFEEIERLKKDGVTEAEVNAAKNKYLADAAYQRDGSFKIAGHLNEAIAVGDWTVYYTLEDAIRKVTAADVRRVANEYWREEHSTVGYFIPVVPPRRGAPGPLPMPAGRSPEAAVAQPAQSARSSRASVATVASLGARSTHLLDAPLYYRDPAVSETAEAADETSQSDPGLRSAQSNTPGQFAQNVVQQKINGIEVLLYRTGVQDVVTFRGAFPAGDALSPPENPAIATLTGELLDKGTRQHDKFQIAQQLENVGATLNFSVDSYSLNFFGQCLRKDLPTVISLVAEQLRTPAFSPEEFEKTRKQLAGALRRQLESTDYRAAEAFSQAVYPPGHPNRETSVADFLAGLQSATLDQVKAFHASHYGPAHMIFAAVGDLDPAQVQQSLASSFAGWTGGVEYPKANSPRGIDAPRETTVFMPDKTSVTVVIGQATGLSYNDPENQALRLATAVLGSGFTGRLMANVRDKEGLTYGIESTVQDDTFNTGDWRIHATFAPALLEKGLASTRHQLENWYENGITADELERRKSNLIGRFKVGLATTTGIAQQLVLNAERGNEPSYLDRYPDIVNRLTLEQVNAAIKKHLNPSAMVQIEAGTVPGAVPDASQAEKR